MMEGDMTEHTRQYYLLEIPTAPREPRRFNLFDAVADVEIEVREIPPVGKEVGSALRQKIPM
jgi:hypothetical protein